MKRLNAAVGKSSLARAKPKPPFQKQGHRKSQRIVIVDDHPILRKGLGRVINSNGGFIVCGEAGEATDGMVLIRKEKPDLVIADIGLPGASGIELTKNIRAEFPDMPVLILSMHEESLYALRAFRAGAMGYMIKQEATEKFADAVREVLNRRRYLSPTIAQQLEAHPEQGPDGQSTNSLTDRELEILKLIGEGREVREIAKILDLSPKTVETHRTRIKEKLDFENARQVARFAVQWVTAQS